MVLLSFEMRKMVGKKQKNSYIGYIVIYPFNLNTASLSSTHHEDVSDPGLHSLGERRVLSQAATRKLGSFSVVFIRFYIDDY